MTYSPYFPSVAPLTKTKPESIKVAFRTPTQGRSTGKLWHAYVYFGRGIAEKLSLNKNDRVLVFTNGPKDWMIKKSSDNRGFSLWESPNKNRLFFKMRWELFVPESPGDFFVVYQFDEKEKCVKFPV